MSVFQSNTDALLVAIPMIAILFAGFFRLDELLGKPKKPVEQRRKMAGWDEKGLPLCADPDFKSPKGPRKPRAVRSTVLEEWMPSGDDSKGGASDDHAEK